MRNREIVCAHLPRDILLEAALVHVPDPVVPRELIKQILREVAAREIVLERRAKLLALHDAVVAAATILRIARRAGVPVS